MIDWAQIIGPALLLYILYKWPYELKINWGCIKIFLKIEAISCFLRGLFFYFFPHLIPKALIYITNKMSLTQLLGVYWEDAFFVLPIVLLSKYIQPKYIIYTFMLFCAYNFGMGHIYQGTLAAFLMGAYVILSYLTRRRIGIGTFIICHIIHDITMATQLKLILN